MADPRPRRRAPAKKKKKKELAHLAQCARPRGGHLHDRRLREVRTSARESARIGAAVRCSFAASDRLACGLPGDSARRPTDNEAALLARWQDSSRAVRNAQLQSSPPGDGVLSTSEKPRSRAEREAARRPGLTLRISRSFRRSCADNTLDCARADDRRCLDSTQLLIGCLTTGELLTPRAIHGQDAQRATRARLNPRAPAAVWECRVVQRLFPRKRCPVSLERGHRCSSRFSREVVGRGRSRCDVGGNHFGLQNFSRSGPALPDHRRDGGCCACDRRPGCTRNRHVPLYQHHNEFADRCSVVLRSTRRLPCSHVGEVYESSARVDVGGDIYDFVSPLDDGACRRAGRRDGTRRRGAADMAMAKFVSSHSPASTPRLATSLRRQRRVVDEDCVRKFIT